MLDAMGSKQAGDLPVCGSGDRDLRTVPRSHREQGLDLSGVGPASGQQKGGKDHELLFWEITYFHARPPPIIKVRQCLEKKFGRNTTNH